MIYKKSSLWFFIFVTLVSSLVVTHGLASAVELGLTWNDNSTDEDGFYIERRVGTSGTYQQIAGVGRNVASYTDANLSNGTTYCYRVRAFNAAGNSAYSNENCATTPAATFAVTLSRSGTGSGTVTSSPAGINCGTDCSETYPSGSPVTLTPVAANGSVFAGWSGNTDCADGNVTVNANIGCTATFNLISNYTLTTSVVSQVTSGGSGSGRVVSNPNGIDCGTDCTESYTSGTVVTLTALPASNSKFTGWTGHSDCSDGSVRMDANKTCTASFAINDVTLSVAKKGNGMATSTPSGINCGSACSSSFVSGSTVSLRASAAPGFTFTGWSGAGCTGTADCNVTLTSSAVVTANFVSSSGDKVGIYRPSTGEWFLDRSGNGGWDDCSTDLCIQPFTGTDGVPVIGDWDGSGVTKVGLFASDSSQWRLDANGNGIWDGCGVDICLDSFGTETDIPVVGQWTSTGHDWIAIFRPTEKRWHLDLNSNGILNRCTVDRCPSFNNYKDGDIPVAGDWTGGGTTQLGLFRPSTGEWFLDRNANRAWNGCAKDICIGSFGISGDIPVSGDWNGTGISKIGVYRPSTGQWFLDLNGNGKFDDCELDLCVPAYGQAGDIPVVGKW